MGSQSSNYVRDFLSYCCATELFSPRMWSRSDSKLVGLEHNDEERLPWQDVRAELRIGIVDSNKLSFDKKYRALQNADIFRLETNMHGLLVDSFSFTNSIEKWLHSQKGFTDSANSSLRGFILGQKQRWMELTDDRDELPVGTLVSDRLVVALVDTVELLTQLCCIKGVPCAMYRKNYDSPVVRHPIVRLIPKQFYSTVSQSDAKIYEKTNHWLQHECFVVESGLDEQKVFNALYAAAQSIRCLTESEQIAQDELLKKIKIRSTGRFNERPDTASLLSFIVNDDGSLKPDSLSVSQHAKAVSCLFNNDNWENCPQGWPKGEVFDEAFNKKVRSFFDRETWYKGSGKSVKREDITNIILHVTFALQLDEEKIKNSPVHDKHDGSPVVFDLFKCEQIASDSSAASSLMDSFYLRDIEKAYNACDGALSEPLKTYLSKNHQPRTDLSDDKDGICLDDCLKPNSVPSGRWPGVDGQFQSVGQQLAINRIVSQMNSDVGGRLMGVNGPPGTGKTTLLKDVIAQIIVSRAEQLLKLENPCDVFREYRAAKKNDSFKSMDYWTLHPDVTGYEMVVASNNNKAVENISKELPEQGSISPDWLSYIQSRYSDVPGGFAFCDVANSMKNDKRGKDKVAGSNEQGNSKDSPTWALLAAALGNKTNRNEFIQPFNKYLIQDLLWDEGKLKQVKSKNWKDAKDAFLVALQKQNELRVERSKKYDFYHNSQYLYSQREQLNVKLREILSEQEQIACNINQVDEQFKVVESLLNHVMQKVNEANDDWKKSNKAYKAHVDYWQKHEVLGFFKYRSRCKEGINLYIREQINSEIVNKYLECATGIRLKRDNLKNAIFSGKTLLSKLKSQEKEIAKQLKNVAGHINEYEAWAAHPTNLGDDSVDLIDEQWNHARAEVFIAALALHQQLILGASEQFRKNLALSCKVITSRGYTDEQQLVGWQTFFLVVPVISSSFASISTMFSDIKREALGWAIIDEAGQATPQSAIGLLQRVQHAVAVGDPMQLEPIDAMPIQIRELLAYTHDIVLEEEFDSVQEKFDYQTQYGMYDSASQAWVGMPLVVHRRCDEPMFSIVNNIAYSGRMVQADLPHHECKYTEGENAGTELPASCWYDVPTSSGKNHSSHYKAAEGQKLYEMLADLIKGGIQPDKIMVITPFKAVSIEIKKVYASVLEDCLHMDERTAQFIAKKKAGTVHISQGQEADVVFLVLGGKNDSSRKWVNSKPNLLNVAVSRAKRRLYVIGSSADWRNYPYTGTILSALTDSNETQS